VRALGLIAILLTARVIGDVSHAAAADDPRRIAVVVGADSDVADVTLDGLRELYLRRRRLWPNGRRAIPVNLPADSPVREAFSTRVLGRSPRDLEGYWNRRYFEGVLPPVVLQTPQAVCAYVAAEPDAIGYLPLGDVDRATCRVLLVLPGAPE
jgi:hypothetical protein